MQLTILGSGTSVPHPRRASPAFWLETSAGSILLDIGPDAPHQIARQQLDWPNLNTIWVSHFHLDHCGGLGPFLFGMRWAPQTQTRTKDLRIVGPKGLKDLINTINDSNNYRLLNQPFSVEITEVDPAEEFKILPGITAITMKTPHTIESLALRLKDQGGKEFVYTSDTGFTTELIEFAKGVDLLLVECSFRRNKPLQTHLELAEAMRLAQDCSPKKLVLTHLYPEWDNLDVATEAKLLWAGDVIEATDGVRVEI